MIDENDQWPSKMTDEQLLSSMIMTNDNDQFKNDYDWLPKMVSGEHTLKKSLGLCLNIRIALALGQIFKGLEEPWPKGTLIFSKFRC